MRETMVTADPRTDRDEETPPDQLADQLADRWGRRRVLGFLLGGAGAAVALAACGSGSSSSAGSSSTSGSSSSNSSSTSSTSSSSSGDCVEIPEETAGPYPGDGSNGPNVLNQDGVVRSDIRSSFNGASGTAEGVPLELELQVVDAGASCSPIAGAAVYAWHCDREGRYSMYTQGATDANYLRGVQVTGADGTVRFTTIFPACYSGRWPHVHFEIYSSVEDATGGGSPIATSQLGFPADVCDTVFAESGYEQSVRNFSGMSLSSDNVFGDDAGEHQIGSVTGDVGNGYTATLVAGIDASV